jgi:hypothetical protein
MHYFCSAQLSSNQVSMDLLLSVQIHSAQTFKFFQKRIVCQIGLKAEDQKKLETTEQYTNTALSFTHDYSAHRCRIP